MMNLSLVPLPLVTRLLEKILGKDITVIYNVSGPAADPLGPREILAVWLETNPDYGSAADFEVSEW